MPHFPVHRFQSLSVDVQIRCENASVDADLFIRIQGPGGFVNIGPNEDLPNLSNLDLQINR